MQRQKLFNREVYVYKDRPKSVPDMLQETVRKYPHKEAIVTEDKRITYSELLEDVYCIAGHLQHYYQLKKGDRVALLIGNRAEFVQMFLACATLGIIVVPLNIRSSQNELMYMINHADVELICAEAVYESVVMQWQSEGEGRCVVCLNKPSKLKDYDLFDSLLVEYGARKTLNKPTINEEDPLYIIFTSGTTGLPKGAVGSHVNVIHSILSFDRVLQLEEKTRTLIAVPLFHVTGLIGQLFFVMSIGGTNVLMENYQTNRMLNLIEQEKITFLFNVPAIYVMMLNHQNFKSINTTSLELIAYGGAPMSQETIEDLKENLTGISLHNAYGATETSSPATIMPKQAGDDMNVDSIGKPVPVSEMKIIDENGSELGRGEVGELYIKGPMVIGEYWRNDEENKKNFIGGYWKSGDMAMIDEEDFVYIMDRKKDVINRGGEKIYSVEVENSLYEHPDVLEVAVVGVPDEIFGESVKAFIVPKDNTTIELRTIQMFLKNKLATYKIPETLEIVDELPRNAGGKIIKHKLTINDAE